VEKDFSALRQAAGLTVREVSDELEISVSTAYRYESGECKPRAKEVQALKGLGIANRRTFSSDDKKMADLHSWTCLPESVVSAEGSTR
jgi:transcriptional regulator with XRE-family HTH domain